MRFTGAVGIALVIGSLAAGCGGGDDDDAAGGDGGGGGECVLSDAELVAAIGAGVVDDKDPLGTGGGCSYDVTFTDDDGEPTGFEAIVLIERYGDEEPNQLGRIQDEGGPVDIGDEAFIGLDDGVVRFGDEHWYVKYNDTTRGSDESGVRDVLRALEQKVT
jgi:hypothetical protein